MTTLQTTRQSVLAAEREASDLIAITDGMLPLEQAIANELQDIERLRRKAARKAREINTRLEIARLEMAGKREVA